jgi:hypothetical protein
MDMLIRIKRLVLAARLNFTGKALLEMDIDDITKEDVGEAIVTATHISKVLKSIRGYREDSGEKLYIIKGRTFSGTPIYTKGKLQRVAIGEVFYVLISSKRAL